MRTCADCRCYEKIHGRGWCEMNMVRFTDDEDKEACMFWVSKKDVRP